jgi:acyl carrier protein
VSALDQLREAIAITLSLDPAEVTETTRQEETGNWDSLAHVNLMVALEETFGVQLEPEDFPRLTSVSAILTYLRERGIT